MKNIIQFNSLSFLLLFTVFAFQSCTQKADVKLNIDYPQLVMYTPTSDKEGLSMKFVWSTFPNSNYTVQISTDNFVNNIDTLLMNKDTTTVSVNGLNSNTMIYARIKAMSKDGSATYADFRTSSLFLVENIFSNQTANIVTAADITTKSVKLAWQADRQVTSIIKTTGSVSDTIKLTAAELTAKIKTDTTLLANTNYTFKIMKNKILRGTVTATTKAK
ncbi:MAG: hypothetical protein ACOYOV_05230 [Bacteroidales bacterium]